MELRAPRFGCPNAPQIMLVQGPCDSHSDADEAPAPDQDLARGVWAEGASENVLHEAFFDVLRLNAGPSTAALPGDIGQSCRTAS
jgi:hypothetical protein